jgi:hypothetical protein
MTSPAVETPRHVRGDDLLSIRSAANELGVARSKVPTLCAIAEVRLRPGGKSCLLSRSDLPRLRRELRRQQRHRQSEAVTGISP